MTKKLEEEFNLPSIDDVNEKQNNEATKNFDVDVTAVDIEDVQTALTTAEKIDHSGRCGTMNHPVFKALLARVDENLVYTIVVYKIDRL